jgi:hypothetical protein
MLRRTTVVLAVVASVCVVMASAASADPTGSKNNLMLPATCNAATVLLVVNSANGQGSGQEDQNTAPFAPAHVVSSTAVFHPTAFNLLFSQTPADGTTQSFLNTNAQANPKTPVTCTIHFSQTDPAGDTFALDGTVAGFLS